MSVDNPIISRPALSALMLGTSVLCACQDEPTDEAPEDAVFLTQQDSMRVSVFVNPKNRASEPVHSAPLVFVAVDEDELTYKEVSPGSFDGTIVIGGIAPYFDARDWDGRTLHAALSTVTEAHSYEDFQHEFSAEASASGSYLGFSASAVAEVARETEKREQADYFSHVHALPSIIVDARVDTTSVHPAFVESFSAAAPGTTINDAASEQEWMKYFETWGSHYQKTSILGAVAMFSYVIDQSEDLAEGSSRLAFEAAYKGISGSASASAEYEESYSDYVSKYNAVLTVDGRGGNDSHLTSASYDESLHGFGAWLESTADLANHNVIQSELRPLWELPGFDEGAAARIGQAYESLTLGVYEITALRVTATTSEKVDGNDDPGMDDDHLCLRIADRFGNSICVPLDNLDRNDFETGATDVFDIDHDALAGINLSFDSRYALDVEISLEHESSNGWLFTDWELDAFVDFTADEIGEKDGLYRLGEGHEVTWLDDSQTLDLPLDPALDSRIE